MDFKLSEQQTMIKNMVAEFAERQLAPNALEIDEKAEFPKENIEQMKGLGLMGMLVPQEFGGAGMDLLSFTVAVEALSRHCTNTANIFSAHNILGTFPIVNFGSDAIKQKLLPQLASGAVLGTMALYEDGILSDFSGMATTYKKDGDSYTLNGEKSFITSAEEAGVFVVLAREDGEEPKLSAFVVEKGTEGFSISQKQSLMGLSATGCGIAKFENCKVGADAILGAEGDGGKIIAHIHDLASIATAAQGLGLGRGSLEESISYSKERVQFGKPIGKFYAIQEKISNMAMKVEGARLLTYKAASLKDEGAPFSNDATMARVLATEAANIAATDGVQIHGGFGYTKEAAVERHFRDSKTLALLGQQNEAMKIALAKSLIDAF